MVCRAVLYESIYLMRMEPIQNVFSVGFWLSVCTMRVPKMVFWSKVILDTHFITVSGGFAWDRCGDTTIAKHQHSCPSSGSVRATPTDSIVTAASIPDTITQLFLTWHLSLVTQSDGNGNSLLRMCLCFLTPVTMMLYLLCRFDSFPMLFKKTSQIQAGKLWARRGKGTLLFREALLRPLTSTAITFTKNVNHWVHWAFIIKWFMPIIFSFGDTYVEQIGILPPLRGWFILITKTLDSQVSITGVQAPRVIWSRRLIESEQLGSQELL